MLRQLPVILWAVDGDNRFTLCVGTGLRGLPANLTPVVGARVQDCLASLPDFPFQIERARRASASAPCAALASACGWKPTTPQCRTSKAAPA